MNYEIIGQHKDKNHPNPYQIFFLFGIFYSPNKKQANQYPD
jgi:hypothetical protein